MIYYVYKVSAYFKNKRYFSARNGVFRWHKIILLLVQILSMKL